MGIGRSSKYRGHDMALYRHSKQGPTPSINFPKGVAKLLGWLSGARQKTANPPPVPPHPTNTFLGYDPGEKHVVDVIDDRTAEEFLYFHKQVAVSSSNVAWIQYFVEDEQLVVGFKNTYVYEYLSIPVALAYDFFTAISKGEWVWDNLRTTRRAYAFLYSLNGRTPVRMEDPAATSVKAALGSTSILGRDPFGHTKSAKRVRIKYAKLSSAQLKMPKFARQVNFSYQFIQPKRQRAGLKKIRSFIRGRP